MNKTESKKVIKVAEKLDWTITVDENNFMFSKFSPAGQDFNIEVTAKNLEELSSELQERYESYDVSEETYLWLDNTGHGANGAPYDMKDLYEDMEACEQMILELHYELQKML